MKLYEINTSIQMLLEQLNPDPETGEVTADTDSIIEQLNSLQLERSAVLEFLAKTVINNRAEAEALKAEEKRLKERRTAVESKNSRILEILDRECGGQTTKLGVATLSYRKTQRVEITDSEAAVKFLTENGCDDCLKITTEINKTSSKRLMADGTEIPGMSVVHEMSYSLR